MHDQLGPTQLVQYAHSLRTFEALHGSAPLPVWSLFAGSGISTHFRRVLGMFWLRRYGVNLELPTGAYAEHNDLKQTFLAMQHGEQILLVDKVHELARVSVTDARGGPSRIVPQPSMIEAGVPCTSRTSLNSNSKSLIDCVQNELGETGIGFKHTCEITTAHQASLALLECVCALWQRSEEGKQNDAEYMVKKFEK